MDPIIDDLPKITAEEARLATRMVFDLVPLKDAHDVLQMLGLEEPPPFQKVCPDCGFNMRKSNGKTWICNRCRGRKEKADRANVDV